MNTQNGLRRIVIAGGGSNGIALAARLCHKLGRTGKALITLIGQPRCQVWRPLLYEIAAAASNVRTEGEATSTPATARPIHILLGWVNDVDRFKREITLALVADEDEQEFVRTRCVGYDTLFLGSPEGLFEMLR